jgi:hypothetical protein
MPERNINNAPITDSTTAAITPARISIESSKDYSMQKLMHV